MFLRYVTILCFLIAPPAFAQTTSAIKADSAKADFEALVIAADNNDAEAVKIHLAKSGHALFSRFASYGLLKCLPKDTQFYLEEPAGAYKLVKAGMSANDGNWKLAKLYFVKEDAKWKWDLNETLRRGIGENWQNQVHTAEQIYLLMRTQMGDQLDCKAIRALVAPMDRPSPREAVTPMQR